MIRHCASCEWCCTITTAQGRIVKICADEEGGSFLQETGLLGWCGDAEEEHTEEASVKDAGKDFELTEF